MRFHFTVIALSLTWSSGTALAQVPHKALSEEMYGSCRARGEPGYAYGRLDEAAWQVAPVAREFIQNEPREGEPATFDTEVRVLYDEEAITSALSPPTPNRPESSSPTSKRTMRLTEATPS